MKKKITELPSIGDHKHWHWKWEYDKDEHAHVFTSVIKLSESGKHIGYIIMRTMVNILSGLRKGYKPYSWDISVGV
ncbi:MAG TPA: hypothetical protein VMX17_11835, partial [Candidatus Glassbacteria bacterium]|nr:hypothetical protein [Candidatus Glassbacteria bacterium]